MSPVQFGSYIVRGKIIPVEHAMRGVRSPVDQVFDALTDVEDADLSFFWEASHENDQEDQFLVLTSEEHRDLAEEAWEIDEGQIAKWRDNASARTMLALLNELPVIDAGKILKALRTGDGNGFDVETGKFVKSEKSAKENPFK